MHVGKGVFSNEGVKEGYYL